MKKCIVTTALLLSGCGSSQLELSPEQPVPSYSRFVEVRDGWIDHPDSISQFANLNCNNQGIEAVDETYNSEIIVTSGLIHSADSHRSFSLNLDYGDKHYGDINGDGCDDILIQNASHLSSVIYDDYDDEFYYQPVTVQTSPYDENALSNEYLRPMLQQYGNLNLQIADLAEDYAEDLLAISFDYDDLQMRLLPAVENSEQAIFSGNYYDFTLHNVTDYRFDQAYFSGVVLGQFSHGSYGLVTLVSDSYNDGFYAQLLEFNQHGERARYQELKIDFRGYSADEITSVHAVDADLDGKDELLFLTNDFSHFTNVNARKIFVVDGEQLQRY